MKKKRTTITTHSNTFKWWRNWGWQDQESRDSQGRLVCLFIFEPLTVFCRLKKGLPLKKIIETKKGKSFNTSYIGKFISTCKKQHLRWTRLVITRAGVSAEQKNGISCDLERWGIWEHWWLREVTFDTYSKKKGSFFVIVLNQEEDAMTLWKIWIEKSCSGKAAECKAELVKNGNIWGSSMNYVGEGRY